MDNFGFSKRGKKGRFHENRGQKMGPKNGSKIGHFGHFLDPFWTLFGPLFWVTFWPILGFQSEGKKDDFMKIGGPKRGPKSDPK